MKKMPFRSLFAGLMLCACTAGFAAAETAPGKTAEKTAPAVAPLPATPLAEIARMQALVPEDAIIVGYANCGELLRSKLNNSFLEMAAGKELKEFKEIVGNDGDSWLVLYLRGFDRAGQRTSFGGAVLTYKPQPKAFDKAVETLNKAAKESKNPVLFKMCKVDGFDALTMDFRDVKQDAVKTASLCIIKISDSQFQFCGELNPEKPFVPALLKARGEIVPVANLLDIQSGLSVSVNVNEISKLAPELKSEDSDPFVGKIQNVEFSLKEKGDFLQFSSIVAALPDAIVPLKAMIAESINEMKENPMFGMIAETVKVTDKDSKIFITGRVPSALILGLAQSSLEQACLADDGQQPEAATPAKKSDGKAAAGETKSAEKKDGKTPAGKKDGKTPAKKN